MVKRGFLFIATLILASGCASKSDQSASVDFEPMVEKAAIQYRFAYKYLQEGNVIRAQNSAVRAVELSPKNPDARNLLGLIYFRKREYDKAEVEFQEAVRLNPKATDALNNLGSLYYEKEEYLAAIKVLTKALENPLYLYPERIHNNLALAYEAMQNYEQAKINYETAIALRPEYYLPLQNLAKMYIAQGEFKLAIPYLEQATLNCTSCVEPRYHLGTALLKQNQTSKALERFKEGFELDPTSYYGKLCEEFLVDK